MPISSNLKSEITNLKSNSGFLKRGKLAARCTTTESKGFTIATPHARVTDLGTEFGVEVDDTGTADVSVFAGLVRLKSSVGDAPGTTLVLGKGERARVEAVSGDIVKLEEQPIKFVRVLPGGRMPEPAATEPFSEDFGETVPARYVLSQSYGKGGTYQIADGKLNLSPGTGNTVTVMLSDGRHGLGVGMRAIVDAPAYDLDSGAAQFFLVSTVPRQPIAQSHGFGLRLRRDGRQHGFRVQNYGAQTTLHSASADPGGPLQLVIERPTRTRLACSYKTAEGKTVPLGEYAIPEIANYPGLFVGVQGWRTKEPVVFAFDNLRIETLNE